LGKENNDQKKPIISGKEKIAESRKDNRAEFKTEKEKLIKEKANANCNNNGDRFYTSPTWRGVSSNRDYFKAYPTTSTFYYWKGENGYPSNWEGMFSKLKIGDLVWVNFNKGLGWSHTVVITGQYTSNGQTLPTFSYHSSDVENKRFIDFWNDSKYQNGGTEPNFVGINFDRQ
jgi:hypothetical protein